MTPRRAHVDVSVGYYAVGLDGLPREKHPKVALHDYPGENHGFAVELGERRGEEAARLADRGIQQFFAEHLS